jgi:hypothetical protein
MLTNITHAGGVEAVDEILFNTPFGYMFDHLAKSPECLLPVAEERTEDALLQLGNAMGEPGTDPDLQLTIPAVFTYLGQFIDHDITARTDRDTDISRIAMSDGRPRPIVPLNPDLVVRNLDNGRRPQLDLDSVYGDGPGLLDNPKVPAKSEAKDLYAADMKLRIQTVGAGFDLPRTGRKALIADMRNDENLNVSQLHAAFLALHNQVVDNIPGSLDNVRKYIKARQMVRWAYQYVVIHDYLMSVCDPNVVRDIRRNGPRFFGPGTGGVEIFMPLEFSAAAFRFGHSMVRPEYTIQTGTTLSINDVLGVSTKPPSPPDPEPNPLLRKNPKTVDLLSGSACDDQLQPQYIIHWSKYAQFPGQPAPQKARKIDSLISKGLFNLTFETEPPVGVMIRHLAKRNLLRGYLLSIPTGQAVAGAMGIEPLTEDEMLNGESPAIRDAIAAGRFQRRTPLWYYVLREAKVQKDGDTLGAVGSRLVAETLIGLIKHDPNSFLNNALHGRVSGRGIKLPGRILPIATIADVLEYAGVPR